MTRIVLLRSWVNKFGRKYPIGQILQLTNATASELLSSKVAIEYYGDYPPSEKVKTDFFKPKK